MRCARRRIDNAAEALLKYMLFTDEALLDAPVKGNIEVSQRSSRLAVREIMRGGRCGISI